MPALLTIVGVFCNFTGFGMLCVPFYVSARCLRVSLLLLMLVVLASPMLVRAEHGVGAHKSDNISYHWVQLAHDSVLARAVVSQGSKCPSIDVDGDVVVMQERINEFYSDGFPIKVCQSKLNSSVKKVSFSDGTSINMPKNADRFAVVGDTGCRPRSQNCVDSDKIPGAEVARALAKHNDVGFVLHVGDLIYSHANPDSAVHSSTDVRQAPSVPYGDNWAVAEHEFFRPWSVVLLSKPVIIARGNHDGCDRAGKIWSVLFDTASAHVDRCQDIAEPYFIDVADSRFLMLDSAAMSDREMLFGNRLSTFKHNMASLAESSREDAKEKILVTHRPFFAVTSTGYHEGGSCRVDAYPPVKVNGCGFTEQSQFVRAFLVESGLTRNVSMVISGHTHSGQLTALQGTNFRPDAPVQLISGNGGAELYKLLYDSPKELIGCMVFCGGYSPSSISNFMYVNSHGFTVLERDDNGGRYVKFYDSGNVLLNKCTVKPGSFICDH